MLATTFLQTEIRSQLDCTWWFSLEMAARESDENQSELGREASNLLGRFGHKLDMGACGK